MPAPYLSCSFTHRPDLGLLIARWPSDAPIPQLQADFAALLQLAIETSTSRWLLDVRRRDELQPEFADWTVRSFFPQAAAQLAPQPLRIAALCSPGRLTVYDSSSDQKLLLAEGMAPAQTYRLRLFLDEGATMEWLTA